VILAFSISNSIPSNLKMLPNRLLGLRILLLSQHTFRYKSFPLMYRTARGAFEQVDKNVLNAARTLGMSEGKIFRKIMIPLAYPGMLAGLVLAFARALGEFGATIMLAGNIPGRTQTISVAIYTAVQGGNRALAYKWTLVVVAISFVSLLLMNISGKLTSYERSKG